MGLGIGGLWVQNRAQFGDQASQVAGIARIARQIAQLFWIGLQIEQLGGKANVVVELPTPLAQHEGTGDRACCMVLAQDDALRVIWRLSQIRKVLPRPVVVQAAAKMLGNGGRDIQQADRRLAYLTWREARTARDQGHRHALLVHVGLAPKATRADIVAVIAGIDNASVLA